MTQAPTKPINIFCPLCGHFTIELEGMGERARTACTSCGVDVQVMRTLDGIPAGKKPRVTVLLPANMEEKAGT